MYCQITAQTWRQVCSQFTQIISLLCTLGMKAQFLSIFNLFPVRGKPLERLFTPEIVFQLGMLQLVSQLLICLTTCFAISFLVQILLINVSKVAHTPLNWESSKCKTLLLEFHRISTVDNSHLSCIKVYCLNGAMRDECNCKSFRNTPSFSLNWSYQFCSNTSTSEETLRIDKLTLMAQLMY